MKINCSHIPYKQTGFFSKIVIDYLNNEEKLKQFYSYTPDMDGIKKAIAGRKNFKTNRNLLVKELKEQYKNISLNQLQQQNLELLLQENTFTITTAHQPNIFTGPLYFIYKILHTIKLANQLKNELPSYNFVPIFYMGSEDADIEELGYVNINGEKLTWHTKQTGAVGRMLIDESFLKIVDRISGEVGVHFYGNELINNIKRCYTLYKPIQNATLEFVNFLFQEYGLLIVIPDNYNLKKEFSDILQKELIENYSNKYLQLTVNQLNNFYKIQTQGREINLFYLRNNQRYRIIKNGDNIGFKNEDNLFETIDFQKEIESNAIAFSPNVILRGVFQEFILPNIAFIGGGGELAYWLELKEVFKQSQVPYPVLFLRNSFLIIESKNVKNLSHLQLTNIELFKSEISLITDAMNKQKNNEFVQSENKAVQQIEEGYMLLQKNLETHYPTLKIHTQNLQTKALKKLDALKKKIIRAEKKRNEELVTKLTVLKQNLFPNNNLQERVDNILSYYSKYGDGFIKQLYKHSLTTEQQFTILKIEE